MSKDISKDPRWLNDSNEGVRKNAGYWSDVQAAEFAFMAGKGVTVENSFPGDEAMRKKYAAYLEAAKTSG